MLLWKSDFPFKVQNSFSSIFFPTKYPMNNLFFYFTGNYPPHPSHSITNVLSNILNKDFNAVTDILFQYLYYTLPYSREAISRNVLLRVEKLWSRAMTPIAYNYVED